MLSSKSILLFCFLLFSGVLNSKTLYNSGSQTFMSRGPILSSTGEYLIYRDTWVMQSHGKATPSEGLCSWPPENRSVAP